MFPTDAATSAWRGYAPLWKVFWLYNIGLYVLLGLILDVALGRGAMRWLFGIFVGLPFMLWSLVSLWRCAFNTEHAFWGFLARIWVILSLPGATLLFAGQSVV
jgi:hypothetical protein